MAFDLTNNEEWMKKFEEKQSLEAQRKLSDEDRAKLLKQHIFGIKE